MKLYIKGQYWMITTIPLDDWGEPERAPLLRGKRCGGPCAKNRDEKRDCNTLL